MDDFKGCGAPLTRRGQASPYGPPPWHMSGRVFTIWYRLQDPAEARNQIAPPLEVPPDPLCRIRFYDITHDAGEGDEWGALNPEQTHFHEAVIAIQCGYQDVQGDYSVHMYADDPTYIAWGREVYGWPLKVGKIHMTRPWQSTQLEGGVRITGVLERFGMRLMTATIELTGLMAAEKRPHGLPNWLTYKTIPDVEGPQPALHQLVVAGPNRINAPEIWEAKGEFELGEGINDELHFLRPREIISADYVPQVDLSVGYGRILEQF